MRQLVALLLLLPSACECERPAFEGDLDELEARGDGLVDSVALPRFDPEVGNHGAHPPERGLRLTLTLSSATVDESLKLLDLEDGRIPSGAGRNRFSRLSLPAVEGVRPGSMPWFERRTQGAVFADGRVRWKTVLDVTAALGMSHHSLVVAGPEGPQRLPFRPDDESEDRCLRNLEDNQEIVDALAEGGQPSPGAELLPLGNRLHITDAACRRQLVLALVIREDGYALHTRDGLIANDCEHYRSDHRGPPTVPRRAGRFDTASLRRCLRRLREISPDENHIDILGLGESVTVLDFVAAWIATVGTRSEPLFDHVHADTLTPTEG